MARSGSELSEHRDPPPQPSPGEAQSRRAEVDHVAARCCILRQRRSRAATDIKDGPSRTRSAQPVGCCAKGRVERLDEQVVQPRLERIGVGHGDHLRRHRSVRRVTGGYARSTRRSSGHTAPGCSDRETRVAVESRVALPKTTAAAAKLGKDDVVDGSTDGDVIQAASTTQRGLESGGHQVVTGATCFQERHVEARCNGDNPPRVAGDRERAVGQCRDEPTVTDPPTVDHVVTHRHRDHRRTGLDRHHPHPERLAGGIPRPHRVSAETSDGHGAQLVGHPCAPSPVFRPSIPAPTRTRRTAGGSDRGPYWNMCSAALTDAPAAARIPGRPRRTWWPGRVAARLVRAVPAGSPQVARPRSPGGAPARWHRRPR